jgi:MFS family permease
MRRGLGLLLAGELLTTSSQLAVQTALGWEAYVRSGDPLVIGLIGLAEFVPALVFALPAGHTADRRDRRLVTAFGLGVIALATAGIGLDTAAVSRTPGRPTGRWWRLPCRRRSCRG